MKFLESVVRHLAASRHEWEKICFVLPSRRAAVFMQKHLAELTEKPIWAPRMSTFNEFVQGLSGMEKADPLELTFELYMAYREVDKNPVSFERFESWAPGILSDFSLIDNYLLNSEGIYSDLRNLVEINDWGFHLGDQDTSRMSLKEYHEFNEFWAILGPLYKRFNQRLESLGRSYSGRLMRMAAETVHQNDPLKSYDLVCFAGFNALSPAEKQIIHHYHDAEKLLVCWDQDDFYVDNKIDRAGFFLRQYKSEAWHTFVPPRKGLLNPEKKLKVYSTSNTFSQARAVGELLHHLNEQEVLEDIALVLADEQMLFPVLESLPHQIKDVNVTMGISFQQSEVYSFVDGFLALHEHANKRASQGLPRAYYHRELISWSKLAVAQLIRQNHFEWLKLEEKIKKGNLNFLHREMLVNRLAYDMEKDVLLQQLFTESDNAKLLDSLVTLLDLASEKASDVLRRGLLKKFTDMCRSLKEVLGRYDFVNDVRTLRKLLSQTVSRETISFVGEPLQGVQVMGLLEARALDFKTVFLLGANEGNLPKGRNYSTFLPFELRAHYELPTYKDHDSVFAYYFYRLIQYPSQVHLFTCGERDEFGGGEPSRFLLQLEAHVKRGSLPFSLEKIELIGNSEDIRDSSICVEKTSEVLEACLNYMQRSISPSALNTFRTCPLDFYFKYVLGIGEEEEVEEDIGNAEMGTAAHYILEHAFKKYEGRVVGKEQLEEMMQRYPDLVEPALKEIDMEHNVETGFNRLVKEVLMTIVKSELHMEMDLDRLVTIEGLEEKFQHECVMNLNGADHSLRFGGIVDRLEREEGIIHVIDYKSGKVEAKDLKIEEVSEEEFMKGQYGKGKAFQLLFYAWVCWKNKPEDVVKASIISLRNLKGGKIPLLINGQEELNAEHFEAFEGVLVQRLEDVLEASVPFVHESKASYCNFCPDKVKSTW